MPPGPKGEKRPADVIDNPAMVMRIATSVEPETASDDGKNKATQAFGKLGGAGEIYTPSERRT